MKTNLLIAAAVSGIALADCGGGGGSSPSIPLPPVPTHTIVPVAPSQAPAPGPSAPAVVYKASIKWSNKPGGLTSTSKLRRQDIGTGLGAFYTGGVGTPIQVALPTAQGGQYEAQAQVQVAPQPATQPTIAYTISDGTSAPTIIDQTGAALVSPGTTPGTATLVGTLTGSVNTTATAPVFTYITVAIACSNGGTPQGIKFGPTGVTYLPDSTGADLSIQGPDCAGSGRNVQLATDELVAPYGARILDSTLGVTPTFPNITPDLNNVNTNTVLVPGNDVNPQDFLLVHTSAAETVKIATVGLAGSQYEGAYEITSGGVFPY